MKKISRTAPMVAILALGSALLFAGNALARGPGAGPTFSELDANGDGQITASEFQAFREGRVTKIDTNGDGFLSADELAAAMKAREAKREQERQQRRFEMLLSRADFNHDGKLSVTEFEDFMQARGRGPMMGADGLPKGWDANGDGKVSEQEFQAAMADMMQRHGRMSGDGGHHGDRGPRGQGGQGTW